MTSLSNIIKMNHVAQGYYVGLMKNYNNPDVIIVQLRKNKDCLDCELWQYLGLRMVTKEYVRGHKFELLDAINLQYGKTFTRIIID